MQKMKTVEYTEKNAVSIITINRPDVMNSFDELLRSELYDAIKHSADNKDIKAVIINGKGRNFCAGADLKDTKDLDKTIESILNDEYRPIFECIINAEKPVIASVHGSAAGIGLSLALICDLMIMADDAYLLSPFSTISLVPDGGMNWMLVNQLGYKRAYQLCIEAERISSDYCIKYGLANKSVPANILQDETMKWAMNIIKRAPLSLKGTKKLMRFAESESWSKTYEMEVSIQQSLQNSYDFKEGVSAFLEKRSPKFKGK